DGQFAVGAEGQAFNAALMYLQDGLDALAGFDAIDLDLVLGDPGDDLLVVGRNHDRIHAVLGPGDRAQLLAGCGVPDLDVLVAAKAAELVAVLDVPNLYERIAAGGHDRAAIGAERHGAEGAAMPGERDRIGSQLDHVPDLDEVVDAA